jgi:hypothetical protein
MATPPDIYTEPEDIDPDTLAHLGPLAPLAGTWEGEGVDLHPVREGTGEARYQERLELAPIDPQPNGPQLLYGLRYHQHILRAGEANTFHDQVGYWLWDAAAGLVYQSLAIPRVQVALAMGRASPGDRTFTLRAERGATTAGICSGPFLEQAFRTLEYTITIRVHADGTFAYEQDTLLQITGRDQLFHHTDRNTLRRVAPPVPNPASLLRE